MMTGSSIRGILYLIERKPLYIQLLPPAPRPPKWKILYDNETGFVDLW